MPRRVLVVEDNPANLELMSYLLRAYGYTVVQVTDGESGIEAALRERPDLIVCDLQLPGIDGFEVAKRLKADQDLRAIPLIGVTAFAMVGDREKVLGSGFDGYISKPIDPKTFVQEAEAAASLEPASREATKIIDDFQSSAIQPGAESHPMVPARVSATILVVDDRPVNRHFLVTLLRYAGHRLLEAEDGADALDVTRTEHPDLIISDVLMPTMDGVEFAKRVHADPALAQIPIIFYTATHRRDEAAALAKECGVMVVLPKPSDPRTILDTVHGVLGLSQIPAQADLLIVHDDEGRSHVGDQNSNLSARLAVLEQLNIEVMRVADRGLKLVGERTNPARAGREIRKSLSTMQVTSARLSALVEVGLELSTQRDPLYLLATTCRAAQDILSAKYAVLGVLDTDGNALKHLFVRGMGSDTQRCLRALQPFAGALGRALVEAQPQRITGLDGDPTSIGLPTGHPSIHSFMVVPILLPSGPYGWLYVANKLGGEEFTADDERFAMTLAAQLASAQENYMLYDEIGGQNLDLQRESVERKRAEDALREAEQRLRSIVQSIDNVLLSVTVPDMDVLYMSPVAEKVYGRPAKEFYASKQLWQQVILPEDRHEISDNIEKLYEDGVFTFNYRIRRTDSEVRWLEARSTVARDANGNAIRIDSVVSDITQRKGYDAELQHLANFDALTGLPNRNLFNDRVTQAIAHAVRDGLRLAVVLLDLDRFQFINDTYGHALGDEFLKAVATRISALVKEGDTIARFGGDECALLLTALERPDDVVPLVSQLLESFAQPIALAGRELFVTASIGVSIFPEDGPTCDILVRNADAAMYRAKNRGGNGFQFYAEEMRAHAQEHVEFASDMRSALERGEFEVHYQPCVELADGRISGAEALVRWRHPVHGLIPPIRFIRLAEETGLIVQIGQWVLRIACAQARAWQAGGHDAMGISVNLSARQLRDPGFAGFVKRALADSGLEARYLELELTESILFDETDVLAKTLRELKAIGVTLALDDFGTGYSSLSYSSLSYLKRFPIDTVKIDSSFVKDVTTDADAAALTNAIVAMARSLDIRTVAEGVETAGQAGFLNSNGCAAIQGYYFAKPMPAAEMTAMLLQDKRLAMGAPDRTTAERILLLLDDEPNMLAALKRLLRPEGYRILAMETTSEAFEALATNAVGVVVSDQRMPGMTGVEFLRNVKKLYPDTVRIVLSGYTELKSVTDAINEGAIYKFLTKPWDDTQLKEHVAEAFKRYELVTENKRLNEEIRTANAELQKRVAGGAATVDGEDRPG